MNLLKMSSGESSSIKISKKSPSTTKTPHKLTKWPSISSPSSPINNSKQGSFLSSNPTHNNPHHSTNLTKAPTSKSTGPPKEPYLQSKTKDSADPAGHSVQSPQLNLTHYSTTNTYLYPNSNSSTALLCMETKDAMAAGLKEHSSTSRTKESPLKFNTLTTQSPKNAKNTEEASRSTP